MQVRLGVMGELVAVVDGTAIAVDSLPRRARELFELLAVAPDRWLVRDVVIESLFGHLDAAAGAANLHKAASVLRGRIGDRDSVVVGGGTVALWPHAEVEVDLADFQRAAEAALELDDADACRRALDLYGGEPLRASRYEQWADPVRDRVNGLHVRLLRVVGDWERLAEVEPTDEHSHRELMRELAASGRQLGVIRQFSRLRGALAERMDASPSAETVELFESLTRGPAVVAPVQELTPMIGRRSERSRAETLIRGAAEGHGSGLLVVGEAGIGKTRFCEEVLETAGARGWTTLRGSAARMEPSPAYGAALEAIARLLEVRPELLAHLPESVVAVLESLMDPAERTAQRTLTPQEITSAIARLVAALARERGVVLFIDDLHAGDEDTVALVHHLIRSAIFQPVLIVVALRPGEGDGLARMKLSELLDGRRAIEIPLGPLNADESVELLERFRPGTSSDLPIGDILDQAGGNPYFLEELAAGNGAHVRRVVDTRLERLPERTRAVLVRLAVAGEHTTGAEVATVAGLAAGDPVDPIAAALSRGLLVADGSGYRFRHGLVRDAILAALDPLERARIHGVVADALVSLGAEPARIAWHRLEAGQIDSAVPIVVRAASIALDRGAHRGARRLVERALTERPIDAELLALRADLAFIAGDPAGPRLYSEAIAAAGVQLRGPLLVRQARACVAGFDPQSAEAALERAATIGADDSALATLVEAQVAWMSGELDRCEGLAERARKMALTSGHIDVLFGAVSLRDLVLHQRGRWPEALRQDLMASGGSPVLASTVHDLHLCGAEAYLYGGRPYEQVKAFARELASTATDAGAARGVAFATTLLGEAELLSGDLESAAAHLSRGVRLHADLRASAGEALTRQRLAQVHLAAGEPERARSELGLALPLARLHPAAAWHLVSRVYGTMIEAAGTPLEALAVVAEGELGAAPGMSQTCPPCSIAFLIPAAIACADSGETERAAEALSRVEPWVDALWAQSGWSAALEEARGHLAHAEGDEAGAHTCLTTAWQRFLAVGQPLDARRCETTLTSIR